MNKRCLVSVIVLAFVSVFIVPPLYGGDNCVAIRGIAQIHLLDFGNPDWEGGRPGDAWVGPVQLALGPDEVLIGKVSEFDGAPGPSNHTGQGRDTGSYFFDFKEQGSFIVRYTHALWPRLPQFVAAFTGKFHANGSVDINNGTGRFRNATGNVMTDGDFLAWGPDQPIPSGRFNNSISGTLCNLAPK
jgi:hypothetical protein